MYFPFCHDVSGLGLGALASCHYCLLCTQLVPLLWGPMYYHRQGKLNRALQLNQTHAVLFNVALLKMSMLFFLLWDPVVRKKPNSKTKCEKMQNYIFEYLPFIQTSNVHSDGMVDFDNTNIYFCFFHLSRIWLSCWHWPVGKTGELDLEVCCQVVGHNSMAAAQHHPLTVIEVDSNQFGVKKKKIHSHNITQLIKTCSF